MEIYKNVVDTIIGMETLEKKVNKFDPLQLIPVFGIYWSRRIQKDKYVLALANNKHTELGDLWAFYQFVSTLGCLYGVYALADKYVW